MYTSSHSFAFIGDPVNRREKENRAKGVAKTHLRCTLQSNRKATPCVMGLGIGEEQKQIGSKGVLHGGRVCTM